MIKTKTLREKLNNKEKIAGGMPQSDIKIWSELQLDMLFAGADWNFVYHGGKETFDNMQIFYK